MKNTRTYARIGALAFLATAALSVSTVPAVAAPASQLPAATQVAGTPLPSWVPADFPIPPGANVAVNTAKSSEVDIVLNGISDTAAYDFYTGALPAAGLKITRDNSVHLGPIVGIVSLDYQGRGVYGTIGSTVGIVGLNIHRSV